MYIKGLALSAYSFVLFGCSSFEPVRVVKPHVEQQEPATPSSVHKPAEKTVIAVKPVQAEKVATAPAKVVPIKSDDLWQHLKNNFAFKPVTHPRITAARNRYLGDRNYFPVVTERAKPFFAYIVAEIEKRHLPLELALLPFVETSFNIRAYSNDPAAGVWQFMDAASDRFNLHRDPWYDGRFDLHDATRAALDYLEYLNDYFEGNWLHALAAYNSGEGRVKAAIRHNQRHNKPTDFWSLSLPKVTEDYVPRLLALKDIIQNAPRYNLELPKMSVKPAVRRVHIDTQLDLRFAAKAAGLSLAQLQDYNPALLRDVTSPKTDIHLLMPHTQAKRLQAKLDKTPKSQWLRWHAYQIKSGDSLSRIARKFGVSIQAIRRENNLKNDLLRIGRSLRIPKIGAVIHKPTPAFKGKKHVVKKGDSLWTISRRYGVEIEHLRKWNKLAHHHHIKPGQVLFLRH